MVDIMKIGDVYRDCISGDKYKVHKVYDNTDVGEAGNIDRIWEVVSKIGRAHV